MIGVPSSAPSVRNSRVLAAIGISGAILGLILVYVAVLLSPWFSWTSNALSQIDGVQGLAKTVFDSALVIDGTARTIFIVGLWMFLGTYRVKTLGYVVFVIANVGAVLGGLFVFTSLPHIIGGVQQFFLTPIAIILIGSAIRRQNSISRARESGAFSYWIGIAGFLVFWIPIVVTIGVFHSSGIGIAEYCFSLLEATWIVVMGVMMFGRRMVE